MDFTVPADQRVTLKESEKKDKHLDLARKLKKKLWSIKVTALPIVIGALGTVTRGLVKGPRGLRNKSGDNPDYSIAEAGQNTKKSPGELKRLTITQTPVKDHQLTLIWKTLKE